MSTTQKSDVLRELRLRLKETRVMGNLRGTMQCHTREMPGSAPGCCTDSNYCPLTLTLTLIIAPPRVAMFGVQRGVSTVQFARSVPELMCHEQGGLLTHPQCGTRFSLSRVCHYLHAKLVQNAKQKLLTFCSILLPFSPTHAHKWRDDARG